MTRPWSWEKNKAAAQKTPRAVDFHRPGSFICVSNSRAKPSSLRRHRLEHGDNYGFGISNYLYNVAPDEYDSIYLCCETGAETLDRELLRHLRKAVVLEYDHA